MEDPFLNSKPARSGQADVPRWRKPVSWFVVGWIFVILISSLLFFWRRDQTIDQLIRFAPVDSILYVSARNSIWPWPGEKIYTLPFQKFYHQANEVFNFLKPLTLQGDILPDANQAGFILLPNEASNQLDWVLIFKLKKHFRIPYFDITADTEKIDYALSVLQDKRNGYNFWQVNNSIFVIASSAESLQKIQEVSAGQIFSLASQVDSRRLGKSLLSLYLNANGLKTYLNQSQSLENKVIDSFIDQDIYLQLNKIGDHWQFQINDSSRRRWFQVFIFFKAERAGGGDSLIQKLPADFKIFISDVNLLDFFQQLAELDFDTAQNFNQLSDLTKRLYDFNFEAATLVFGRLAEVIVFDASDNNYLGFDFVLALPSFSQQEINDFEQLVKIFLAQKLPKETVHLLSDGSLVTELVAQPENWYWQKEKIDDSEVYYLIEPALNFEVNYLLSDSRTLISNSRDRLKQVLVNQGISVRDLDLKCGNKKSSAQYLILNDYLPLNNYLSPALVLIRDNNGCIVSF